MTETTRRCALPGCAVPIQDTPGRPPRRYCTAAHRSAARQARRAAMQNGADARLAATLPWLAEPGPAEGPAPAAEPSPGPAVVAPRVPGDRAARRRAVALAGGSGPPPGRRTGGLHAPVPRHRRALAVLGAAGILAGGYAVTSSGPVPSTSAEVAVSEQEWAREARVTLASVNRQLDAIAQVEAEWLQLPAERRSASPAAPVQALEQRRELLENRRATLLSQLDAFEELDTVRADLAEAERSLQELESTLAAAPPPAQRSPEQATALSALDEQRDLRIRQRDARRDELAALEGGVESAVARPLPDDVAETEQVGEDVRRVIRGEDVPTPAPADPVPSRPEVVNGRDEPGGPPRQDVDTSGPPDPRGPGEGPVDVPPPDPAPPAGPVDQLAQGVDGAVGAVVDGGSRDRDRERSADRPGDPAPAGPAAGAAPDAPGPVETVVDTVEGVVDGPAPRDEGPRERDGDDDRGGPVGEVVDTVGDVVAGPDQPADEARDRERDRGDRRESDAERSTAGEGEPDDGPAPAIGSGPSLSPAVDTVGDALPSPRPAVDDRYPDAPVQPAAAAVSPVRDADGSRTADAAPAVRALPVEAPVEAPDPAPAAPPAEAAVALGVVRSTPAASWAAPLVEAAVEEAARQEAEQDPAPAAAGPTPGEQAVAAAALGMWGFDDESIDALNEMAAASGQGSAPAYERSAAETYRTSAETEGPAPGDAGSGSGHPGAETGYVAYAESLGYAVPDPAGYGDAAADAGYGESPSDGDRPGGDAAPEGSGSGGDAGYDGADDDGSGEAADRDTDPASGYDPDPGYDSPSGYDPGSDDPASDLSGSDDSGPDVSGPDDSGPDDSDPDDSDPDDSDPDDSDPDDSDPDDSRFDAAVSDDAGAADGPDVADGADDDGSEGSGPGDGDDSDHGDGASGDDSDDGSGGDSDSAYGDDDQEY